MRWVKAVAATLALAGFMWSAWWVVGLPVHMESAMFGAAIMGWAKWYGMPKECRDEHV